MLLLGPLLPFASAAVVTEVPPFLRGDVQIAYSYEQLSGSLVERAGTEDVEVGKRAISQHLLDYSLVFSAGPGVAVFVDVPHYVSSQVSYDEAQKMVYDPSSGSGTYQGTNSATPGTYVDGAGIGGIWFGVRGTPFSEAFTKRNSRSTWLLEGAIRTPDSTNLWSAENDKRGAGPGGLGTRFHTAFSTTFGNSAPYISGTYEGEGKVTVTVANPSGSTGKEVELDPANHGEIRTGVELLAGRNPASGSLFVFDLHLGVAYHSYAMVPSGFFLPNVLDASEGDVVLQAEQFDTGAGMAIHWRVFENLQVGLHGDAAYHLPQRIEYPYPVYTGADTIDFKLGTSLAVRFR